MTGAEARITPEAIGEDLANWRLREAYEGMVGRIAARAQQIIREETGFRFVLAAGVNIDTHLPPVVYGALAFHASAVLDELGEGASAKVRCAVDALQSVASVTFTLFDPLSPKKGKADQSFWERMVLAHYLGNSESLLYGAELGWGAPAHADGPAQDVLERAKREARAEFSRSGQEASIEVRVQWRTDAHPIIDRILKARPTLSHNAAAKALEEAPEYAALKTGAHIPDRRQVAVWIGRERENRRLPPRSKKK